MFEATAPVEINNVEQCRFLQSRNDLLNHQTMPSPEEALICSATIAFMKALLSLHSLLV